ncbi:MAG: biotin/lipoyl-containing protein [Gemmatimonadota bacterium]
MRYYVTIGERTFEVDLAGGKVTVDGEPVDVELLPVSGTPLRRLAVNGQSHRLIADRGDVRGEWDLHLDAERVIADVVDERTRAIRALTARSTATHAPKPVRAPMPGMVVRVEVRPGDKVKAGQGVVIMEAMKMENELKADAAGTVSKVAIAAGTAVEKGVVLIEFAADG